MVLLLPAMFAPVIFGVIKPCSIIGQKCIVIAILILSILPLVKLLKFEAAYRRVRKSKAEEAKAETDLDRPYFGNLSFSDRIMS